MSSPSVPKLFQPTVVGTRALAHRVVLAPLTRYRSQPDGVPGLHVAAYYAQRAAVPGTLLISEATFIAPFAAGYRGVPGLWSEAQVEGWKRVSSWQSSRVITGGVGLMRVEGYTGCA